MAITTTFNEGPVTVTVDGVVGPTRLLNSTTVTEISVTLTSTSGDWAAKAGSGAFSWGIEYSSDAGAHWRWFVHNPGDGAAVDQFLIGAVSRSGGMDILSIGAAALKGLVGDALRLRATTVPLTMNPPTLTPTVNVGAAISVTH